ncbi:hypothetical protein EUX98_g1084 [Antrodiella citrinella]|uniref:Aminoglycoside phosphotransferase domain-containing protein n=1 Tax=Antrodiella citrinella TaxID=2447956 RepID=A0A4S4N2D5_9APHY|nr:hypothetical protein EUX98_g1084 [Antrodiella citrinella]
MTAIARDLSTAADVLAYLEDTPFTSTKAIPLAGGFGNYVFRLHLKVPYEGHETLVLKHGKPYLPGNQAFAFSLDRQTYEVGALKRIREWLPNDSLVTVPVVHLYDNVAAVIIMDDCGEGFATLKQLMLDSPPSSTIAQQIGRELGQFLARLHTWSTSNESVLDFFDKNAQARAISVYATYGRIISTLKGQDAPPAVVDPVLDIPPDDLSSVQKIAEQTTKEMMTTKETLVMGDFWPGNVIVVWSNDASPPTLERIYILDWELVKPGIAGLDVGQFLAEMHLLRRCRPYCAESASAVMNAFQESYRAAHEGPVSEVADKALVHVGAHLVVWTPRNDWGTKEKTRELVQEGVLYLLSGGRGEAEEIVKGLRG